MDPQEPGVIEDFEKWEKVLYQMKIPITTWTKMVHLYQNYVNEFDPNIIRFSDDIQFCQIVSGFFHFSKVTVKGCKTEFIAWLKEHWEHFSAPSFMKICNNCIKAVQEFNQENPNCQRPFINWIPLYGGLLCEPAQFPHELEMHYRDAHRIPINEPPALVQNFETNKQTSKPSSCMNSMITSHGNSLSNKIIKSEMVGEVTMSGYFFVFIICIARVICMINDFMEDNLVQK
jgi:hypothetical protein